jgi:hypothetical protein
LSFITVPTQVTFPFSRCALKFAGNITSFSRQPSLPFLPLSLNCNDLLPLQSTVSLFVLDINFDLFLMCSDVHLSSLILTTWYVLYFHCVSVYLFFFCRWITKVPGTDLLLFLVFANKQDLPGALSMEEIREVLVHSVLAPLEYILLFFCPSDAQMFGAEKIILHLLIVYQMQLH